MDQPDFDKAERTIVGLLYEMTDAQRESILYTVKAKTSTVKTVLVSRYDLKRAVKSELKTDPTEPVLELMERSAIWKGLEESLAAAAAREINEMLAGFRQG
ncbi:hypothetical protein [Arthrobacter sp. UYCo732]|uniref:hypothetical protein n=1 Tax=Arthrobacter sp. UYCo732 TaxID=3156336 RepID=UPI003391E460